MKVLAPGEKGYSGGPRSHKILTSDNVLDVVLDLGAFVQSQNKRVAAICVDHRTMGLIAKSDLNGMDIPRDLSQCTVFGWKVIIDPHANGMYVVSA